MKNIIGAFFLGTILVLSSFFTPARRDFLQYDFVFDTITNPVNDTITYNILEDRYEYDYHITIDPTGTDTANVTVYFETNNSGTYDYWYTATTFACTDSIGKDTTFSGNHTPMRHRFRVVTADTQSTIALISAVYRKIQ